MNQQKAIEKAIFINDLNILGWRITHVAMSSGCEWVGYEREPLKGDGYWATNFGRIERLGKAELWAESLAKVPNLRDH